MLNKDSFIFSESCARASYDISGKIFVWFEFDNLLKIDFDVLGVIFFVLDTFFVMNLSSAEK